jgi:GNAT superfamily N-acetyltransferase
VRDLEIMRAGPAQLSALGHVFGPYYGRLYAERAALPGAVLVAVTGGRPVAAMYVSTDRPAEHQIVDHLGEVPMLHRLLVHEAVRRRRVGTRLVLDAEAWLRARGYDRVAVGVDLENHDADLFWRSLDYREWPYGLLKTYREHEVDGVGVMQPDECRVFTKDLLGQ